jgi:hypothetical protein
MDIYIRVDRFIWVYFVQDMDQFSVGSCGGCNEYPHSIENGIFLPPDVLKEASVPWRYIVCNQYKSYAILCALTPALISKCPPRPMQ